MDTTQEGVSIQEALANMASATPENFSLYFRRMRKVFPDEVAEACLWCIASRGLDAAGRSMALWLILEGRFINVLLDPKSLPVDVASKAAVALKTLDPQFMIRFLKAAEQLTEPAAIMRGLSLLPALGDYSVLLSWLRAICQHKDQRVCSRAVKLLCEIRPNQGLVERQMRSEDPRVRANAIEALWNSRTPDAVAVFKSASSDKHHRVVGNALVGLHLQGDESAFPRMLELSKHPDHLFRAAMAWCFGRILDKSTIPLLHTLAKDSSMIVRKRALQSLLALQTDEVAAQAPTVPEPKAVEPLPEPAPATPAESKPAEETKTAPTRMFQMFR